MSLSKTFELIGPLLEGQKSLAAVQDDIQREAPMMDASSLANLEIYQRFCAGHRRSALTLFTETRRLYTEDHGADGWLSLLERYFVAHPMFHAELNANGALFADFCKALTDDDDFDDVYGELADFEYWEFWTTVQPDVDLSGEGLRLSPLADIRSYGYDFVAWFDQGCQGRPQSRECLVVFWRDQDDDGRRARVSARELAVVRQVHMNEPIHPDWQETVDDLLAAGILLK